MYETFLTVRDYECDSQGIVNNAVYQNYLEHSRHEYLKNIGISFSEAVENGIFLVLVEIKIMFKKSLKSQNDFKVCTDIVRLSKLRFGFQQKIYHIPSQQLYVEANCVVVAKDKNNRLLIYDLLNKEAPLN